MFGAVMKAPVDVALLILLYACTVFFHHLGKGLDFFLWRPPTADAMREEEKKHRPVARWRVQVLVLLVRAVCCEK